MSAGYIIYPSNQKSKMHKLGGPDPVKMYTKHFMNDRILRYLMSRSRHFIVRQRANAELEICERKQAFWEKKVLKELIPHIHKECERQKMAFIVDYYNYL